MTKSHRTNDKVGRGSFKTVVKVGERCIKNHLCGSLEPFIYVAQNYNNFPSEDYKVSDKLADPPVFK